MFGSQATGTVHGGGTQYGGRPPWQTGAVLRVRERVVAAAAAATTTRSSVISARRAADVLTQASTVDRPRRN